MEGKNEGKRMKTRSEQKRSRKIMKEESEVIENQGSENRMGKEMQRRWRKFSGDATEKDEEDGVHGQRYARKQEVQIKRGKKMKEEL